MLITILAWIYISMICLGWGIMVQALFFSRSEEKSFRNPGILWFTGLAAVGVVAGWLSLAIPLGGMVPHLVIAFPPLVYFFKHRFPARIFFRDYLPKLRFPFFLLLLSGSLMLLVLSAWYISHPDTLTYHMQTVLWIESYPVVPGLSHLDARLGYQGSWFVLLALFSFRFLQADALSFINSAAMLWFIIFLVYEMAASANARERLLWLLLLAFSLWDYNQLRLTATSGGNDFIAALFAWGAIWFFVQRNPRPFEVLLFSVFAVSLKLSLAPVLLLPLFSFFLDLKKSPGKLLAFILAGVILFMPVPVRNYFTSGFLLYPSPFPDLVNPIWKMDFTHVATEKDYINAWARKPGISHAQAADIAGLPLSAWFSDWWQSTLAVYKFLLLLIPAALLPAMLLMRKTRLGLRNILLAATLLTGIVFWFLNAPDPRFGIGFLVPAAGLLLGILFTALPNGESKILTGFPVLAISALMLLYAGYRLNHYFDAVNMLRPHGIKKAEYISVDCGGVVFSLPADGECRDAPIPCLKTSCDSIRLRGNSIRQGFVSPILRDGSGEPGY